jgi:hypothetical protein
MIRSTPFGLVDEGPSRCRPDLNGRESPRGTLPINRPQTRSYRCLDRCGNRVYNHGQRCDECIKRRKRDWLNA